MNRPELIKLFVNNDVQGILYLEYLEYASEKDKSIVGYNRFITIIQNILGMNINNFINYVLGQIREKYNIIFIFDKNDKILKIT